jgi:hypothetical protein
VGGLAGDEKRLETRQPGEGDGQYGDFHHPSGQGVQDSQLSMARSIGQLGSVFDVLVNCAMKNAMLASAPGRLSAFERFSSPC